MDRNPPPFYDQSYVQNSAPRCQSDGPGMHDQTSTQSSVRLVHEGPAMLRLRRRANGVAVVLALVWLLLIAMTISPQVDDFKWYWQGARSFLEMGDPYRMRADPAHTLPVQPPASQENKDDDVLYSYPPPFAYLIQPFGLIDYQTAQWAWFGLNTLLLFSLMRLCARISGAALPRRWWGIFVLAMLIAPPTRLSLQLGQVSILIAVMLVGCLALERRPFAAGLLLATASWIKLTPAVIGLRYALRRPRSVLWCTIGAAAAVLVASLALYGVDPYLSFIENVIFGREYPYAAEHNISLYGFWSRLLTHSRYAVPLVDIPGLARALTALSCLAILGLCVWATGETADARGGALQFCLWLCAMMLVSPSNGYYNLVALLLPLLVVLRHLELFPDRRARQWLIFATVLACIPPTWSDWQPVLYNTAHIGWGLIVLTPSLYGLLIYTLLLARLARRYRLHQDIPNNANDYQHIP